TWGVRVLQPLAVEPVRGERQAAHHPLPALRIPQPAQGRVVAAGDDADTPRVVVRLQAQRRHAAVRLETRAEGDGQVAVEVPPEVDEPGIVPLLGRTPAADRLDPLRQRRAAATGVDDHIGPDVTVPGPNPDRTPRAVG